MFGSRIEEQSGLDVLALKRKIANRILPLTFEAAYDHYFKVINRHVDRQAARYDEDARHLLARRNPGCGVTGHSLAVVRDDDPSFVCRPPQHLRVLRLTQPNFIRSNRVELRDAAAESAQDSVVEVLIYE